MTTILLLGAGGQLGQEIIERASGLEMRIAPRTRRDLDIADAPAVQRCLETVAPALVVNAAAYTEVDRAEVEAEEAFRANAEGPRVLACGCVAAGVPLIHISTDYVFDGTKAGSYREGDPVAPLGVYGASKAAGEDAVRRNAPRHLILRTSWLFGQYGSNFLKTVLRLANERDSIRMVADQRGCPTATADLAEAILALAPQAAGGGAPWGTYHVAGNGVTTWHGFAQEIVERLAHVTGRRSHVIQISTADYPTLARRPANSELDSGKFAATFRFRAKPWQERVREVIGTLIKKGNTK